MTKDIFSGRKVTNFRVIETRYQRTLALEINKLIAQGFVLVSEPLLQQTGVETKYIAYLYEFATEEVQL